MAGKPAYLWSLFTMKCPHCRKGPMFKDPNPWHIKSMLKMHVRCPECNQLYELEVGFWFGTAYVSYAFTVIFCGLSFLLWWLTIGFSLTDHRFFWWLGINGVLLLLLQPWFMRISRVVWLYFFVSYDEHYKEHAPKTLDYSSEAFFLREETPSK
jgi:hypothetical protein